MIDWCEIKNTKCRTANLKSAGISENLRPIINQRENIYVN